jgi:hypothetical protein
MEGRLETPAPRPEVPYGYCYCGCGGLAPIARKTIGRRGITKGEPLRFIDRHQNGYNPRGARRKGPDWIAEDRGYTTPCWIWQHYRDPAGYGRLGAKLAHRIAYEYHRGPIPEGLQLDHLCRVTSCCNPDHLEPVPQRVNYERGNGCTPLQRAAEIRALFQAGYRVADICRAYQIGNSAVYSIGQYKTRAHARPYEGDVHTLAFARRIGRPRHDYPRRYSLPNR